MFISLAIPIIVRNNEKLTLRKSLGNRPSTVTAGSEYLLALVEQLNDFLNVNNSIKRAKAFVVSLFTFDTILDLNDSG
jgi:hypothetical protein